MRAPARFEAYESSVAIPSPPSISRGYYMQGADVPRTTSYCAEYSAQSYPAQEPLQTSEQGLMHRTLRYYRLAGK
jgi:hypothetical protein